MKLGIMQPYFFPYLGYWQLMNAVDKYVLLDDVNFIMRGYINRNSILINGKSILFSIPLDKPSQNKLIMETKLKFDNKAKEDFKKTINLAYKKAPMYENFYPVLENIIDNNTDNLTCYIKYSFEKIKEYLNLNTQFLLSSEINKNNSLKGEDRIIEINKKLNASIYINAIGGMELYNKDNFKKENIELKFLKMNSVSYKQFKNDFIPNLSMIDVLMFNSVEETKKLLCDYTLI